MGNQNINNIHIEQLHIYIYKLIYVCDMVSYSLIFLDTHLLYVHTNVILDIFPLPFLPITFDGF